MGSTLNRYLDLAKNRLNLEHDAELARRLHITRSGLCRMRQNGDLGDDTAVHLAAILKTEPAALLLEARADKSSNRKVVASVRRILLEYPRHDKAR